MGQIRNFFKYPIVMSIYVLIIGWTFVILGLIFWTYNNIYSETYLLAQREAYKGFQKDVMFRSWASMHGGVYVPITHETPPNPYLSNIPERDIVTQSGKKLTLMNPAYITRQVHELSLKKSGIRGHITSLNPIRKESEADSWEKSALYKFEQGRKEYYGIDTIKKVKYFRYMSPLITEKACLKCHESQGYKLGDIRGGISSSVPWIYYEASINKQTRSILIGYGTLWIIGFIALMLVKRRFVIYIARRDEYEHDMKKLNEELYISKSMTEEILLERNQLVEEISETNNKLEKLNSEKDKFFSIIAHDLKSPFNGLIGLTVLITEDAENLSKEEIIELNMHIHRAAKNLFKLLENLLEWAQMQNGMVSFNPTKLKLEDAIHQNIYLNEQKIKQKQITIRCIIDNEICVNADENMLNSVLRNLLSNALKFTPTNGNITIRGIKRNAKEIEVSVSDSGIGMSELLRNKLFKLEEKVGRPGLDKEQSTGLGLLLCKEFIEKHGGNIWVDSEEGKGSTFFFTIPNC